MIVLLNFVFNIRVRFGTVIFFSNPDSELGFEFSKMKKIKIRIQVPIQSKSTGDRSLLWYQLLKYLFLFQIATADSKVSIRFISWIYQSVDHLSHGSLKNSTGTSQNRPIQRHKWLCPKDLQKWRHKSFLSRLSHEQLRNCWSRCWFSVVRDLEKQIQGVVSKREPAERSCITGHRQHVVYYGHVFNIPIISHSNSHAILKQSKWHDRFDR